MRQQMHPAMRIVFAALGAVVGATLFGDGEHLFAIAVGALAGLAVFEVVFLRDRLTKVERELQELQRDQERAPAPAPVAEAVQRLREAAPYVPPSAPVPQQPAPRPAPPASPIPETRTYTDTPD